MFGITLSWSELLRRAWKDSLADDIAGLAAQLSYYFFLALFPALLFLLSLASFFSLSTMTDDVGRALGPFVSPQILDLMQDQMRRIANDENGGLLTVGAAGAFWSSSAALVSIVGALNRAYDIEEGRPWWKVRLIALGLTMGVAAFACVRWRSYWLVRRSRTNSARPPVWARPLCGPGRFCTGRFAFALTATAIGLIYYFAPDADQDWEWITPGAILATVLWLIASIILKIYIANFTHYSDAYGSIGGVIVLLLWFYVSGLAILAGAELNAEIEHASPHGKPPGQKNKDGRRMLGRRAERQYCETQARGGASS
jgi:membrane protein